MSQAWRILVGVLALVVVLTAAAVSRAESPADPEQVSKDAEEYARRVRELMERQGAETPQSEPAASEPAIARPDPKPRSIPKVEWIDAPKTAPAPPPQPVVVAPAPQPPATQPVAEVKSEPPATQPAPVAAVPPPALDRNALLVRLLDDIRAGKDPALYKAMSAAALSLVDPDRRLEEADLAALTAPQRQHVERYHQLIVMLADRLASNDSQKNTDEIVQRLNELGGQDTLRIRDIQLCKKVSGYGVYEPFDGTSFLAGKDQPMIVYVELDNFRSVQDAAEQFTVKLTQEIVLYNEADGLAVWKQPATQIVDESRNKRRDFFVVQLIRLPARLGVGKYRLKVRINDLHGGSIDETTVPIQLVADKGVFTSAERSR